MTRKHFTAIANILAGQFASASSPAEKLAIWTTTLSLAQYFKSENSNFSYDRFYLAVFGTEDHFAVRDAAVRANNNYVAARYADARRTEV